MLEDVKKYLLRLGWSINQRLYPSNSIFNSSCGKYTIRIENPENQNILILQVEKLRNLNIKIFRVDDSNNDENTFKTNLQKVLDEFDN